MNLTVLGTMMEVKAVQSMKARLLMVVTELGIVTVVKAEQSLKAA